MQALEPPQAEAAFPLGSESKCSSTGAPASVLIQNFFTEKAPSAPGLRLKRDVALFGGVEKPPNPPASVRLLDRF
jgi:hypothetical protein